jgi:hypothetical protein
LSFKKVVFISLTFAALSWLFKSGSIKYESKENEILDTQNNSIEFGSNHSKQFKLNTEILIGDKKNNLHEVKNIQGTNSYSIKKTNSETPISQLQNSYSSWQLNQTDFDAEILNAVFNNSEPIKIVYFKEETNLEIYPTESLDPEKINGSTLFAGNTNAVKKTAEERNKRAQSKLTQSQNYDQKFTENIINLNLKKLKENDFEIVYFKAGNRDNGGLLVPMNSDYISALQGPDFFSSFADNQKQQSMEDILSRVLSLGHGGELMIKVKNNGFIYNKSGFDFAIYENAVKAGNINHHEFAFVGVSDREQPSTFKWFICKPEQNILHGCAGAVPTTDGGDQFDLSEVGLEKVKYIVIRDMGRNKNFSSKWPTEGADIDSIRIYNAFGE